MIPTTRTGNTLEAADPGSRGGSVRHVQHALATEEAGQGRPSIPRQRRNVAMEVGNAHGDEDDIHAAVGQAPDFRREVLEQMRDASMREDAHADFRLTQQLQVHGFPHLFLRDDDSQHYVLLARGYMGYAELRPVVEAGLRQLAART